MSGRPAPLPRAAYATFRRIGTRWGDNDVFGHVNNVVYYAWFDSAVTGWLLENLAVDPARSEVIFVVAATRCDYFGSVGFPETVEIGLAVERIGRSSVTYRLGVFREGRAEPAAQGQFTHVYVRREGQAPVPVPEDARAALERMRAPVFSS